MNLALQMCNQRSGGQDRSPAGRATAPGFFSFAMGPRASIGRTTMPKTSRQESHRSIHQPLPKETPVSAAPADIEANRWRRTFDKKHSEGRRLMANESSALKKEAEVRLRIVLVATPAGVDFGIQEGKGSLYKTIHKQTSQDVDLIFEIMVTVKDNREDGLPNFLGPLTHGPTTGRFIYINIGKSAGQLDSCWDRRIKVPLGGITWEMINKTTSKLVLEARLPGKGKDGGPSCATVKPTDGWKVCRR